ncbi:glycosyltransferase [Azospirillum agricola]|uniref:glycosyltransferase n=1 Tax=Azospirillum agricola TaxID=1720247 RepID=UPI0015C47948|nr:glycosyltransferase [Azospirillum agricola]
MRDLVRRLLDRALVRVLGGGFRPRSVLHVSYMVHVPYYTVQILRQEGFDAAYMAVDESPLWDRADFRFTPNHRLGFVRLNEWFWFWRIMARYETVHFHFMITPSELGWEVEELKRLGRNVVVHFRGCEARDRDRNIALHPVLNICQDCDYRPHICKLPRSTLRRDLAARYADLILVTTPDMRDFLPEAQHFPFFAPVDAVLPPPSGVLWPERSRFKIVHATTHPGIEGTTAIQAAVDRLQAKGYPIDFIFLRNVKHSEVLQALADADLAIGKMKMGYYANAQIESLCCGVPTITWIRPDLMSAELKESGFIFSNLHDLADTIEYYFNHPEELAYKRAIARQSILRLHDNRAVARQLIALYDSLSEHRRDGIAR